MKIKHFLHLLLIVFSVVLIMPHTSRGEVQGDATGDGKLGLEDAIYILQELTGFQHTADSDKDGYDASVDCDDNNPNIHPNAPETCNGLDDDCDEIADEDNPGGGGACSTGQPGVCEAGTESCTDGSLVCNADNTGSTEVCDGLDNDCDGQADEGNPGGGGACNTGQPGLCEAGTQFCVSGSLVCTPDNTGSTEVCDGLDNDCDGQADEGNPGGGGACNTGQPGLCEAGTESCEDGNLVCNPDTSPSTETCDGLDNDCDGQTDEGFDIGNACGVGACEGGTKVCSNDGSSSVCSTEDLASEEICNDSIDNDCDGEIDENCIERKVFLTSVEYKGNMGGLTGADALCNGLASNAGLSGTYKAWLSDDSSSPSDRFTHHGQFVLVDESPVANSWSDLTDANIINPIIMDEKGGTHTGEIAWGNTDWDGSRNIYAESCLNWTTESYDSIEDIYRGRGVYSDHTDYRWSNPSPSIPCDRNHRLYCFEQ